MVYPGQAFQGEYDFGAGLVNLRLENRRINGEYALLGWITPEKPKPRNLSLKKDWRNEAVTGVVQWAKDYPWLAAVVGVVVAVAIAIVRLIGD